jgi:twitching motility protein PilU
MDGKITQDEAMANADSATNMLWLINQATAGEITGQSMPKDARPEEKKESLLSGRDASFGNFKIDVNG